MYIERVANGSDGERMRTDMKNLPPPRRQKQNCVQIERNNCESNAGGE